MRRSRCLALIVLAVAVLALANLCQADADARSAFVSGVYTDANLDHVLVERRANEQSLAVLECAAFVVASAAAAAAMWPRNLKRRSQPTHNTAAGRDHEDALVSGTNRHARPQP